MPLSLDQRPPNQPQGTSGITNSNAINLLLVAVAYDSDRIIAVKRARCRASLEMRIAASWSNIGFDRIQVRGAMPAPDGELPLVY